MGKTRLFDKKSADRFSKNRGGTREARAAIAAAKRNEEAQGGSSSSGSSSSQTSSHDGENTCPYTNSYGTQCNWEQPCDYHLWESARCQEKNGSGRVCRWEEPCRFHETPGK